MDTLNRRNYGKSDVTNIACNMTWYNNLVASSHENPMWLFSVN